MSRSVGRPKLNLSDEEKKERYKAAHDKAIKKYQQSQNYKEYKKDYVRLNYLDKRKADVIMVCNHHDIPEYIPDIENTKDIQELSTLRKIILRHIELKKELALPKGVPCNILFFEDLKMPWDDFWQDSKEELEQKKQDRKLKQKIVDNHNKTINASA